MKVPKIKNSDLRLEGERILLRPLKMSDAKDIYFNIQDKEIAENNENIPWPYKLKDAKSFIRKSESLFRKKESFVFGIELKGKKGVIGVISLSRVNFLYKNARIGYWLGKKYRGQGIMTEAGKLVLNFAFKKLRLHRVYTTIFPENLASQRVLEKLGFKKEGVLRHACFKSNRWRDDVMYSLLKNEWKMIK